MYEQPTETPPNAAIQCWFGVLGKSIALECYVHLCFGRIEVHRKDFFHVLCVAPVQC